MLRLMRIENNESIMKSNIEVPEKNNLEEEQPDGLAVLLLSNYPTYLRQRSAGGFLWVVNHFLNHNIESYY